MICLVITPSPPYSIPGESREVLQMLTVYLFHYEVISVFHIFHSSYNQIMEYIPSMIAGAVELQKFKLGAHAFLLGVDGPHSNLCPSVFKYFSIPFTYCFNFTNFFIFIFLFFFSIVISCGNCQHESVSFEPFTILSLALPVSGNSTLKRWLHNYYEDTFITYKCPQCSKEGESFRKTTIQKMPPILVLHLNRFE